MIKKYNFADFSRIKTRTIVLVGLMGAGKTSVGRCLAARMELCFVDTDHEIEAATNCSITDFFKLYGKSTFRNNERRIVTQLLSKDAQVMATGGGTFLDPEIRALIKKIGISIWLKADLDLLIRRTSQHNNRPLLQTGEPHKILDKLMAERYPIYKQADLIVEVVDEPLEKTVDRVIQALQTLPFERTI